MLFALAAAIALPRFTWSNTVPLGVSPDSASLYAPVTSTTPATWTCLDGNQTIPYAAINDDYCDCLDGSDEPGTSACPNGVFYCKNEGHIGATIQSSHVNDGLCELECCDGSDEPNGICPNMCKEIGEKHRAEKEAERKTTKTGAKIRSSYIAYAKKEINRLKSARTTLQKEVDEKRSEEKRLKASLEHAETVDASALEHQKESPLYRSLLSHNAALTVLRARQTELQTKLSTLEEILAGLKRSYNPNYQDMGVLEAVRGWDAYHGVEQPEPATDQTNADPLATEAEIVEAEATTYASEDDPEAIPEGQTQEPELEEEDEWTTEKLDKLTGEDHVALLLEHARHISGGQAKGDKTQGLVRTIEQYLPVSLQAPALSLLSSLRIAVTSTAPSDSTSEAAVRARNTYNDATNKLSKAERELTENNDALSKLEAGGHFGKDGEWKKLDGTCLEKDTGEYTYSICLFGAATQKSNKDHSSHNLGRFSGWNDKEGVSVGSREYYTRQYYKGGARCWNGPERSVIFDIACGTENAILTIAEPEKCEYLFTGTSPALCWPPDEKPKINGKEEL